MNAEALGRKIAEEGCRKGRYAGRREGTRLYQAVKDIEHSRRRLSGKSWDRLPTSVEWLLDNAYLAHREGLAAREELRRGKHLRSGGDKSYLQTAADAFIEAFPTVDQKSLLLFLKGLQETVPFTEEELSLFLPALKGALCRRLAQHCSVLEKDPEREGLSGELEGIFTGLRTLSTANLWPLLERSSPVEQLLKKDPAGAYPGMDEATRARYRQTVCLLARRWGLEEYQVAQKALALAQEGRGEEKHVGWFLFRRPLGEGEKSPSGVLYVSLILLPTLSLALLLGFLLESGTLFFLLLLPASDLMKNMVDFFSTRLVKPRPVLRMELKDGIPTEGRTLCVIAGLLTGQKSGDCYAALLERYRLANRDSGEELRFGLLADLPDRASPMGEEERRWVEGARAAIEALNEKYHGEFFLFFRQPIFQTSDERYVGWERKRGALLELARLLKGRQSGINVRAGNAGNLVGTRYIITLDSDTALNVGTARELVGAMLHPLNHPQVDPKRRVVTAGYGLLQPRVEVELGAANRSQFSRIYAGQGGIDPYGGACSDVYHDLFDRGSYTGKGIFDLDAYLQCMDGRFPQNRILSHDLLEGAYLHAGLLAEVELTDGYPYSVIGYFSRLHRWVRGDWQLLPWLGRWVRDEGGKRVRNPISSVDKWKLFDNLRRSLSPVCTMVALLLGMCLSAPAFGAAAAMAIISAWSNLLLSGADLAVRGGTGLHRRYHATIIAGPGGMILQTLVQLLFLPYHAWVCSSAILTALWRCFVSRKKLLEWVTAADSERKKGGIWVNFRSQWPAVAVGVFAMAFARFPAGSAVGMIWGVSPLFSWAMSRPRKEGHSANEDDRPFLLHQAGLIWGYFRDWLREEDHWLPPDNVQEKPWLGPARRTSPTNIGMALLSCVAAVDLELTGRREAVLKIRHILDTLETLPKWRGHLYNWYDTSDCTPLRPRYVSTVDSGNLRGCLIALREALYEWGEDVLARKAETLSNAMDLSILYNSERKLFSIGYDVEREEFSSGWYDLMASEARLASYLAIALGEVDPRHWRRLGRGLVGENDYCGMVSWTGTMFEYFMPNLLLPCEEGSLMYESLSFCIYAQKRRGSRTGKPWGISESGFYAFDPGNAYQYKASGVQALGLKRGLDQDLVVAPYASFLALLLAPRSAGRNLRRLRNMGLEGTYGLYEAVDFTPVRLPAGEDWEPVCSFMSHHLGMSLVAIDNVLRDGIMQKRFLRDCSMGAFRELLQEKVPVGADVIKPDRQAGPDRLRPIRQSQYCLRGSEIDPARPTCHILSNGLVCAICTDDGGVSLLDDRGEAPIAARFRERYAPAGVSFFYRDEEENVWPLTMGPLREEGNYGWSFDGGGASWNEKQKGFTAKIRLILPKGERGALWSLALEGVQGGEIVCYLEPVLARPADYEAHPAYSKLSLECHPLDQGVCYTRRPKTGERRASLAVLWDREEARWDASREKALGRGGLRNLKKALKKEAGENWGVVIDPCLLLRIPLSEKEEHHLRLALGVGDGEGSAQKTATAILSAPDQQLGRLDGLLRELSLSSGEGKRVMELLSMLAFPGSRHREAPQSALWAFGVSGDLPIAAVFPPQEEEPISPFPMKAYLLLKRCGFSFDLVYLLADGGNYLRPQKNSVLEVLRPLGLEDQLGKKGGIHLVEQPDRDAASLWKSWAAVMINAQGNWKDERISPMQPPELALCEEGEPIQWKILPEGEFELKIKGSLPPLGWSQLLVNPRFGWLTDETGCGHLWQGNSREGAITPWNNDPLAVGGPEWFLLRFQGESHSIFASGDSLPTTVTYGFGWAKWEKTWSGGVVRTTAVVPWNDDRRLILIELPEENTVGELRQILAGKGEKEYLIRRRICLSTGEKGTVCVSPEEFERELSFTKGKWRETVCPLTVHTPDQELNQYLNGWCLYQVTACRLLGRTSRYQNGGAYGFRDQLQDALALLPFDPGWLRAQILRCCAHQFQEGDVQHWWHEVGREKNRGVRTRISDDLLWLPYCLGRYIKSYKDWKILSEQVNYLSADPLKKGEAERYFIPGSTVETEDVYTHALRAVQCVLDRGTGEHGLLKMGTGDWNDGMNEVGRKGKGESVWLTWFAVVVLDGFLPLAAHQKDGEAEALCREWAPRLRKAAEQAWDGQWYLRGWYDDGSPLGSHQSRECRLDSIAQSWAVFAGGEGTKTETAVRSALEQLFDREKGIIKLFTPAFDAGNAHPGYIRGYLPGVRENGGQYTHASAWLALACFELGWKEEGWELLHSLLPATHPTEIYRGEPYVLAGDVYAHPQQMGRAGWSWYTGAAGWFHQAAVQGLLGMTVEDGALRIRPSLPKSWPGWSACWRRKEGTLTITVCRAACSRCLLDGKSVDQIPLEGLEGEHQIEITVSEGK